MKTSSMTGAKVLRSSKSDGWLDSAWPKFEALFWLAVLSAVCVSSTAFAQYGTLDTTWAGTGYTKTSILSPSASNATDAARAVAVQLDGKVVIAGVCNNGTVYHLCVARYNTDGSLDTSFNGSGTATYAIAGGDPNFQATAIGLTPYGQIVVVSNCRDTATTKTQFCAVRFTKAGSLDTTFGASGLLRSALPDNTNYPSAIAFQNDGRFILGGLCGSRLCALRYFEDGSLIDTFTPFGTAGVALNTVTGTFNRETFTMAVDASDRVLIAGSCFVSSRTVFCVTRFTADGQLDTSFGVNGIAANDLFASSAYAYGMSVQNDGKILLAGQTFNNIGGTNLQDYAVVRYTENGAVDTGFGSNGVVITRVANWDSTARAIVSYADGRFVVAGICQDFPERRDRFCLAGYSANGALDSTFGSGGIAKPTLVGQADQAYAIALGRDGKLLVAGSCRYASGSSQRDFCVARYNGPSTDGLACVVDLSGDGNIRATQDSLALARLTRGVWNDNPSAVIFAFNSVIFSPQQYWVPFKRWLRGSFDYDGDGAETTTDSIIHARIAVGMSGNTVTSGLTLAPNATRTTWAAIRNHFVSRCGMTLPP